MEDLSPAEEGGLSLRHQLDVIRRRRWLVLAVLIATAGPALALTLTLPPTYKATTKIVVGQGNSLFQPGQANAVQPFTATMSDLVKSHVVARDVVSALDLNTTANELLDHVDVSINPETAVLTITVKESNPRLAQAIAAELGTVFSQLVEERFGATAVTATPEQPAQPPLTATVWDPAHADADPISPKPARDGLIAIGLGLVLALLAAFLRDHFDRTIRSEATVEESFGVPVLGQIPFEPRRSRTAERAGAVWTDFPAGAESYRALRANLRYLGVRRPIRTVLITSASPEQGKTTVTANLAIAIARAGPSVVVVEADLRRPQLPRSFGIATRSRGLTGVLIGATPLEAALQQVPIAAGDNGAARREIGDVFLLGSGPLPPNPSELISSPQMKDIVERLSKMYDYVLIDSPPLLPVADGIELAVMVDAMIVVVRRNRGTVDEAREIRRLADRLGIHLAGAVFTDAKPLASYYGPYGEPVPQEAEAPVSELSV